MIACGQNEIYFDTCVSCGGWLDRIQRGGFPGPHGWLFCEPACIDDQVEHEARLDIERHLAVRDLLCDCPVCTDAGLPTRAMRDEYAAYRAVEGVS